MSEHTKGPWTWNGGYLVSYIPDKFSASGCQDFEIIVDDGSAHGEYDVVLNPDSANARLIASAPELLEALENLLAVHEGEGGTKYHAGDIARAAIAKAKGQ